MRKSDKSDVYYWAARAAEERRIVESLSDGPTAAIHRQLAELYEQAVRRGPANAETAAPTDVTDPREVHLRQQASTTGGDC